MASDTSSPPCSSSSPLPSSTARSTGCGSSRRRARRPDLHADTMNQLFARKSVADFEADVATHGGLKRTLGKWHLTALGVGATIGAGIFATTGTAIVGDPLRPGAGPAIVISFLLTALTCAEFAAMVPISGSAYTYAYASLGELVAWIIGWDLIIEYAVGNIGVAI